MRRGLSLIEPAHLQGLSAIYLEDELAREAGPAGEEAWVARVRAEGNAEHVGGFYSPPTTDSPARITLYVRTIYRSIPSFLRPTPATSLRLGRVIAHEVAHHLAATKGYRAGRVKTDADEEDIAEEYASEVVRRALERWPYRLGNFMLKEAANWQYSFGCVAWGRGEYEAAARRFLYAWQLDRDNEHARHWYWCARKKLAP